MALMVMGIGVVSVATLFPIAILRSLQATQITNATILRLNAESMIDINRNLVHDPDGNGNEVEHNVAGNNYIVDPLGWNTMNVAPLQTVVGTDGNGNSPALPTLTRYSAGFGTLPLAENLVTLPDSWETIVTTTGATVDTGTYATVTLPPNIDSGDLKTAQDSAATNAVRFTIMSENGRLSQSRLLAASDINPAAKTVNINPVLPNVGYNQASVVRIETQERNYTWLLTVRKSASGAANVDVVVFFRRTLPAPGLAVPVGTPFDEQVYTNIGLGANLRQWIVNLSNGPRPDFLKKGGFLFDYGHARWYRIVDLDESNTQIVLTLDHPAPLGENIARAVFPRGVVDVYPLRNKL